MKTLCWVLLLLWCCFNTIVQFWGCITSCSEALSALGTIITAIIAGFALFYSIKEYRNHRLQAKVTVLSKYNERYSSSPEIKNVIKYLIAREEYDKNPKLLSNKAKLRESIVNSPVRDREMFMRFFGELQAAINADLIDKEYAKVMFGYYAVAANKLGEKFVPDYHEVYWTLFRNFAESMSELDYARCLNIMRKNRKSQQYYEKNIITSGIC